MTDHSNTTTNQNGKAPSEQNILVTGANSGLGFEAAAQLAEAGYGSIILAARSQQKADTAKSQLTTRTGRDVFETLVIDVADSASSRLATAKLIDRGAAIDGLLLNAGAVLTDLVLTDDGLEGIFAASLFGHHIITSELIGAGMLSPGPCHHRWIGGRQQRYAQGHGFCRARLRPATVGR